jgi:hypothetical protein
MRSGFHSFILTASTRLRDQGSPTDRKYQFIVDGAKALRTAIEEVFGAEQPVQRYRKRGDAQRAR